jgi:hypothetical protein
MFALIGMFLLGIWYGRCIERKKQRGINICKPKEWFRG